MFSFKMLLSALALTLLAVTVESWSDGNLSGSELTRLYNSPVYLAERMRRPKGSSSSAVGPLRAFFFALFDSPAVGPFSHTGVRVTLGDNTRWLVHKGLNYGISSDTVVTRDRQMSSDWKVIRTGNFQGRKTVGDFVATGGSDYNLLFDNCHWASRRMMDQ